MKGRFLSIVLCLFSLVGIDKSYGQVCDNPPTQASAGSDQLTCTDLVTLEGNVPSVGSGSWSCDAGTLLDETNPTAQLSGLIENFTVSCVWSISNGCSETTDEVMITRQGDVTIPVISIDGV